MSLTEEFSSSMEIKSSLVINVKKHLALHAQICYYIKPTVELFCLSKPKDGQADVIPFTQRHCVKLMHLQIENLPLHDGG